MSRKRDQEFEFVSIMATEGVPPGVCRDLMRLAARLHREAELQCSDEATDRDHVPCPGAAKGSEFCLCGAANGLQHETVTRSAVREFRARRQVETLCAPYGVKPVFQGDPRGAVVKLKVPSGRTNDWGHIGICVP